MDPDVGWHEECDACGCAATWHDAATGKCAGYEFQGCLMGCTGFVRRPPTNELGAHNG